MSTARSTFARRYGPWAVIAGASAGLGAAYAHALARRGLDLVLIARRAEMLQTLAEDLRQRHGIRVEAMALDLADAELAARLETVAAEREVGLGIYNAAFSPIGVFVERPLDDLLRVVDVNVRAPLIFARTLAPAMRERRRGGLVLMSSLAGEQGSPRIATYAASKAFNTVLAEGLWHELGESWVDVLVSCAGAIRTPGYTAASSREAPGTLDPETVAEQTLGALSMGPRVVPGMINRVASMVLGRWLPRRAAVAVMASSTKDLR